MNEACNDVKYDTAGLEYIKGRTKVCDINVNSNVGLSEENVLKKIDVEICTDINGACRLNKVFDNRKLIMSMNVSDVEMHEADIENIPCLNVHPSGEDGVKTKNEAKDLNETIPVDKFYNFKLAHLNVNGWNKNNGSIREHILLSTDADFICINESHLKQNENLILEGYQWIGQNRRDQHVKAVRAFGGIGIFYKNTIADEFDITNLDSEHDGILTILFTHKLTKYKLAITVCYLPPEHSRHGRNATGYFTHLIGEIYRQDNIDLSIYAGDFNARTGKINDYIEDIDEIGAREFKDLTSNQHGSAFIELLLESNCCMLNGRFGESSSDFTSISSKGTAVVDYIAVPINDFSNFVAFEVHSCNEILNKLQLANLQNKRCKTPDHALLICEFTTSAILEIKTDKFEQETVNTPSEKRYSRGRITENFFKLENFTQDIEKLKENISMCDESSESINYIYSNICNLVIDEMDKRLLVKESRLDPKRNHVKKPFCTPELNDLFKKVINKERAMKKCKHRASKRGIRHEYKLAQNDFENITELRKESSSTER